MGCDIRLYLAPTTRYERVVVALGALHGLPLEKIRSLSSRHKEDENKFYVTCPSINVKAVERWLSAVRIEFTTPHGEGRSMYYMFEPDGAGDFGGVPAGYRLLSMPTSARNIAIARKLVNLFGGRAIFNDCGERTFADPDVKVSANPLNAAQNAAPYWRINRLLSELKPLTQKEIAAEAKRAAYPYDPTGEDGICDWGFDAEGFALATEVKLARWYAAGYRRTRGGRMVQFISNDPQNPDHDRRKVWRFIDDGTEFRTDINGKFAVDFAPYEHPFDVEGVE